jgi:hypothetical protein
MQTVNIQAKYINEPSPGKKNWSIKDENGIIYSIPPNLAQPMQQGDQYTLQYEESTFNGRVYKMVKGVMAVSPTPAASASQTLAVERPRDNTIGIFGILNHYINTGVIPLEEQAIAAAWTLIANGVRLGQLAAAPKKSLDYMDDEIPF